MQMKIEDEKFYMLEAGGDKWIYDTEKNASASMKQKISENEELNSENVTLWEVTPSGEKWEIKQVPWSKIAIGMIRGEE